MSHFENPTTESLADVREAMLRRHPTFGKHVVFVGPMYLVMQDFGRGGYQGVVCPEHSRRNIVEQLASREVDSVVSVLEITLGEPPRDITADIRSEAEALRLAAE
jgi:hypothetical protein